MASRIPLTNSEGLTVLGMIVTMAVSWGVITTKLAAQDRKIEELAPVPVQIAVMRERVEAIDKRTDSTERMVRELWSYLLPNDRKPVGLGNRP